MTGTGPVGEGWSGAPAGPGDRAGVPSGGPPAVLSIAGSDPSGGAGIQADLKTFAAHRVYGMAVVTALTAQNTVAVRDVFTVPASVVAGQLAAVLDDLPLAAVKVGMLGTPEVAAAVATRARAGQLPNLVLDPVLLASTGHRLGVVAAVERLLPHAMVLTPNREEASALVGWPVSTPTDMAEAAVQLAAAGARYVVVTGGDAGGGEACDALCTPDGVRLLRTARVDSANTHGTGCTFSAAIAARLAGGEPVPDAVEGAKDFVTRALRGSVGWRLGAGTGPLDHNDPGPLGHNHAGPLGRIDDGHNHQEEPR